MIHKTNFILTCFLLHSLCSAMQKPLPSQQKESDDKIEQQKELPPATRLVKIANQLDALNLWPNVISPIIAQYGCPAIGWVLPWIDLDCNNYQRREATARKGEEEVNIIGIEDGQLVSRQYYFNNKKPQKTYNV